MQVIDYGDYIEIIPENTYLTDLDETDLFEGICGKINPANYKDITDEEAEEIRKRLFPEEYEDNDENEESAEIEERVENNE